MAQAQALWITAFLIDRLESLSKIDEAFVEKIKDETAVTTAYERLRHPPEAGGYGDKHGDMALESLPYVDLLLRDLGLVWRRKEGLLAWLKDIFEPYAQKDYVGLVNEWLSLVKDHRTQLEAD